MGNAILIGAFSAVLGFKVTSSCCLIEIIIVQL